MRKEVLFAIMAGVLFGLVTAFGIWRANIAIKVAPGEVSTSNTKSSKSEDLIKKDNTQITLAKPEKNGVLGEETTIISGLTKPNSSVVISSEDEDFIIKTDINGAFEQEIKLIPGVNQTLINAYSDNQLYKDNLIVVYSTEFFKQLKSPPNSKDENRNVNEDEENRATSASDIIPEKVQEKLKMAKNKPKALMGTITDITKEALEIKNSDEEIKQIAISTENISYVDIKKGTKKVSFEDLAIGDFVVAMGFQNENSTLEAKRILVTSPPDPLSRQIIFAIIKDFQKKKATIKSLEQQEFELVFGKRWKGPEINELSKGNLYVFVVTKDKKDLVVRTVQEIFKDSNQDNIPSVTPKTNNQ